MNRFSKLFTFLNAMEVFVIHFMANCVYMTRSIATKIKKIKVVKAADHVICVEVR